MTLRGLVQLIHPDIYCQTWANWNSEIKARFADTQNEDDKVIVQLQDHFDIVKSNDPEVQCAVFRQDRKADLVRNRYIFLESHRKMDLYECVACIRTFRIEIPDVHRNEVSNYCFVEMNSFAYLAYLFIGEAFMKKCPEFVSEPCYSSEGDIINQYFLPIPSLASNQYTRLIALQFMQVRIRLELEKKPSIFVKEFEEASISGKVFSDIAKDVWEIMLKYIYYFHEILWYENRVRNPRILNEWVYLNMEERRATAQYVWKTIAYPYRWIATERKLRNTKFFSFNCNRINDYTTCIVLFIHSHKDYFHPREFELDPIISAGLDMSFGGELLINALYLRKNINELTHGRTQELPKGMYIIPIAKFLGDEKPSGVLSIHKIRQGANFNSSHNTLLGIQFPENSPEFYVTIVAGIRFVFEYDVGRLNVLN